MSTNKTQHYKLHSWAAADHFLRAEINENFTTLDAALKSGLAAQDSARQGLIVTGSYTGDGADSQTITLGFRPRAVLVRAANGAASDNYRTYSALAVTGRNAVNNEGTTILALAAGGFQACYSAREGSGFLAPRVNSKGQVYAYVAVR